MEIKSFSTEILSLIMGHLPEPDDDTDPDTETNFQDVYNARQVCQQWNEVASQHVFKTVSLRHTDDAFTVWNDMLDNEMIRNVAQHAVLHSGTDDFLERDYEDWMVWEQGEWEEFTDSIARISELKNLKSLYLRFSKYCWGVENNDDWDTHVEKMAPRRYFLEAVFKAMIDRACNKDSRTIRSLTIENLQNLPIPDMIASDLFKEATKDIDQLNLMIQEEYNEHGPDRDLERIERQTFEPFLQNIMLPAFADRLTSLTLYFQTTWGVAPGTFNGHGLVFPHLKTLALGNFLMAHHNQFDWLLSSTLLRSLRLDNCYICTHIEVNHQLVDEWKIPMHDWVQQPDGAFGVGPTNGSPYTFSGTWGQVLDKIRTSLLHLVDFCLHHSEYGLTYKRPEWLTNELSEERYIAACIGNSPTGCRMGDFGGNVNRAIRMIDPAKDHLEDDSRALKELNEAIAERRRLL